MADYVKEVSGFARSHDKAEQRSARFALWRIYEHLKKIAKDSAADGILKQIERI